MIEDVLALLDPSSIGLRVAGAVTGVIGAASALSVAIPSVVDRILPPPIQDELWQYLPFERIHKDRKTIVCKGGRYVRAIELKGAEVTLASDEARERLFDARKHFFDELEKYGVDHVKIFQIKERVVLKRELQPRHELMREIGEAWEGTFPSPFMLRHYVLIVAKAGSYAAASGILDPAETFAVSTLAEYKPSVMIEATDEEVAGLEDQARPSGPLKPFAHVISPISRPNPYGGQWAGALSALVTGDDVDFTDSDRGRVMFHNGEETRYACLLTLRDCGEKTSEAIIRDILAVDCEMLVYHAVEPISQAIAVVSLNRGRAASVGEHLSLNAKESYDEALREVEGAVSGERSSLVFYAMHVMPMASSMKELRAIEARIRAVMTRSAGSVVTLHQSAQPTLFSTVSFDQIWPRRFRFRSKNVAANVYPQKSEIGMIRSDWCNEPIAWFKTVGGDPYPFHFHAHSGRNAPAHAMLIGPTGSGKAQPNHVCVMTPRGEIPIGLIRPGELVYAEDGKAYPVIGVFPQGVKRRFRVNFSDDRSTECCDEHLWNVFSYEGGTTVVDGMKEGEWQTLPLKEIMRRFPTRAGKRMGIPLPAALEREEGDLPIAPYTLGALIGDGCLLGKVTISTADQEILETIREENPDLIVRHQDRYDYYLIEKERTTGVTSVREKPSSRNRLRALELFDKGGHEKEIPLEYLTASIAQRTRLLQGLMDTDGTVGVRGGASYCTVSSKLALQVVDLVRSLGGTARISHRSPYYTYGGTRLIGRDAYQVNIKMAKTSSVFTLSRKVALCQDRRERALRLRFESFEELEPCEMTCISVASPSSLYVAEGHVVTHNTSLLTFLASQAMRIERLRIFLLDRLNGMKIFTTCAGGRYITFDGDARNAALNPLHLPDSPENRKFLQRWLRLLAETDDMEADQEIARTVSLIYDTGQPLAHRNLAAITKAAFSPTGIVRQNMQIWTDPKAYGGYFNAEQDSLDLGRNPLVAFNMTEILVDERLAPPMVDYLVHRIKDLSITTTAPSLVLIDESKPMMRNKRFAVDFLQTGLQEGRKLGQAYVLCFQTPQAMVDTGMSQIMLDQCGLQIIFRNPRDSESAAAQYEMFGLNQAELDFVCGRTFKDKRYAVLIRRPHSNESAIVDVDLSRLGRLMGVFESDARQVASLDGFLVDKPREQAVRMYLDARR